MVSLPFPLEHGRPDHRGTEYEGRGLRYPEPGYPDKDPEEEERIYPVRPGLQGFCRRAAVLDKTEQSQIWRSCFRFSAEPRAPAGPQGLRACRDRRRAGTSAYLQAQLRNRVFDKRGPDYHGQEVDGAPGLDEHFDLY